MLAGHHDGKSRILILLFAPPPRFGDVERQQRLDNGGVVSKPADAAFNIEHPFVEISADLDFLRVVEHGDRYHFFDVANSRSGNQTTEECADAELTSTFPARAPSESCRGNIKITCRYSTPVDDATPAFERISQDFT